ncbi:hypothetical protein NP233_g6900 [Leucocoprinus birnbaumii]|uniref:Uncharacterized protein n=1 Tax=Leucocoprinus birnbaumii TaxID=56174 RepID=A0AAD5VVS4_9AGAR|nr:hypothetical protein NP233_g6900 [Leucocoprinus birnbaumii]
MLRAYALYELDSRILFTLVFLLVFKLCNVLICWFVLIPRLTFNAVCAPTNARPMRIGIFIGVELLMQGIPIYLTFRRGAKIKQQTRKKKIMSLIAYLRRDGVLSWAAVSMYCISFLSIAFGTRNIVDVLMRISYPIFITFMSSLGCHLLLHMDRRNAGTTAESSVSASVSFELDTLDETWDARSVDGDTATECQVNPINSEPPPNVVRDVYPGTS